MVVVMMFMVHDGAMMMLVGMAVVMNATCSCVIMMFVRMFMSVVMVVVMREMNIKFHAGDVRIFAGAKCGGDSRRA